MVFASEIKLAVKLLQKKQLEQTEKKFEGAKLKLKQEKMET